jgi:hypothetical protein
MMRRVPLSCFMFSSVCVLGILLVASQLNVGKSGPPFQHRASSFLLKEDSYAQGTIHVLALPNQEQFFLPALLQDGLHTKSNFALTSLFPCSQEQVLHALLEPGVLEIWDTGSLNVPVNSHFEPQYHAIPDGKPLFTGADLDPKSLSMGQDPITGYYFIKFSMKGAAALELTSFTSHNIGSYITITLEKVVVSSIMLHYALPGKGQFEMSPHSLALSGVKCVVV